MLRAGDGVVETLGAVKMSNAENVPEENPELKPPANGDARTGQRPAECARPSLSCEWPHLSEAINDLKKKLFGSQPSKTKRDDRS